MLSKYNKIKLSKRIVSRQYALTGLMIGLMIISILLERRIQVVVDLLQFTPATLLVIAAGYIVIAIISFLIEYNRRRIELESFAEIQEELYNNALLYGDIDDSNLGELLYKYTEDIYSVSAWKGTGQFIYAALIISVICYALFSIYIDVILGCILLFMTAINLIVIKKTAGQLGKCENLKKKTYAELNEFLLDSIRNAATIRQLSKDEYFINIYTKLQKEKAFPAAKKTAKANAANISQLVFCQEVLPFVVVFAGLLLIPFGKATIGSTIAMMDLSVRFAGQIQSLGDCLPAKKLFNEVMEQNDSEYFPKTVLCEGTKEFDTFKDLSIDIAHCYVDGKELTALRNFNCKIVRGSYWQISGRSGNGKTTLLKLISGCSDIQLVGSIELNGVKVQEYNKSEYERKVQYLPDNSMIFEGNLYDNILLGRDLDENRLGEVCGICALESVFQSSYFELETLEKGKNLSGGQKQLIGLARALYGEPEVLLLDEPLGAISESLRDRIVSNLLDYSERYNSTIIMVTHQPSELIPQNRRIALD